MKYLYVIILSFVASSITFCQGSMIVKKSQLKNPFETLKYTCVIAYNFALEGSHEKNSSAVTEDKKLNRTTVLPGKNLTKEETNSLISTLVDTNTYGGSYAACFEPRLAFVFYNNDSIVDCIDVCFECNTQRSTINIPAKNYYNEQDGELMYLRYGFSKAGRKRLIALCKKLNMPYCVADGKSMFDK